VFALYDICPVGLCILCDSATWQCDYFIHVSSNVLSQEVETEQFYSYFQPALKKSGYEGVFSAKSRARTMSEQERKHVDGCAIFYKTSKYVESVITSVLIHVLT